MALIDDVKNLCDRLAPLGSRDLLLAVTSKIPTVSNTTRNQPQRLVLLIKPGEKAKVLTRGPQGEFELEFTEAVLGGQRSAIAMDIRNQKRVLKT